MSRAAKETVSYQDQVVPSEGLYKVSGIGMASIIGTCLSAGYLIAKNYRALGLNRQAKQATLSSYLGFILWLGLFFIGAETALVFVPLLFLLQLIVIVLITKNLQGKAITQHEFNGGRIHSNWLAIIISFIMLQFILMFSAITLLLISIISNNSL